MVSQLYLIIHHNFLSAVVKKAIHLFLLTLRVFMGVQMPIVKTAASLNKSLVLKLMYWYSVVRF